MPKRRIILFFGILLTICKILPAQVSSNSYSMEIVTESDKKEIKSAINTENCKFEMVPDGRNFAIRYLVVAFPSYILIDREGKLIRYYDGNDLTRLQQDIKHQFLQK